MAKSQKMGRMPKEQAAGPANDLQSQRKGRKAPPGVKPIKPGVYPSPGMQEKPMRKPPEMGMMPPKFQPGPIPPPQMMPPAFGGGGGAWGDFGLGGNIAIDKPIPMPGPPVRGGWVSMPGISMPPMTGGNLSDYIGKKGGMPGMGPGPTPMPPGMMPPVREPGSPGGIPGTPGGPPLSLDIPPEVKAEWDRFDQENQKRLDGLYNQPPPEGYDPAEWKRFMEDMRKAEQENSGKYAGLPQSNGDIMQLLASQGGGALPMPAPAGIRSMIGNEPMQGVPQMTGRERNRMSRIQPQRGPRERV